MTYWEETAAMILLATILQVKISILLMALEIFTNTIPSIILILPKNYRDIQINPFNEQIKYSFKRITYIAFLSEKLS